MTRLDCPPGTGLLAARAAALLQQRAADAAPTLSADQRHIAARALSLVRRWRAALVFARGGDGPPPCVATLSSLRMVLTVVDAASDPDAAFAAAERALDGLPSRDESLDAAQLFHRLAARIAGLLAARAAGRNDLLSASTSPDTQRFDAAPEPVLLPPGGEEGLRLCALIRRRLEEYDPAEYNADGPRVLLRLIERAVALFEARLSEPGAAEPHSQPELRLTILRLQELAGWLPLLDTIAPHRVPNALIASMERKLRRLPHCRGAILLAPQPVWTHAPASADIGRHFRALFADVVPPPVLETCFHQLPPSLVVVRFPDVERDNILLHPLLGRDIGYLIAAAYLAGPGESVLADLLRAARTAPDTNTRAAVDRLLTTCRLWEDAVRELVADCVGVRLYGPAALLAAARLAERDGYDDGGADTPAGAPPWRHRCAVALRQLDRLGLMAALETARTEQTTLLRHALRAIAEMARPLTDETGRGDNVAAAVYGQLAARWDDIEAFLEQAVPADDWATDPAAFLALSQTLAERLHNLIPPNADESDPARPVAASDVSVMLAAWIAYLDRRSEPDARERFDIYCRLAMKALDDLELCRRGDPSHP